MAGCFDHLNKSAAQVFIPNIDCGDRRRADARVEEQTATLCLFGLRTVGDQNNDAPAKRRFKAAKKNRPAASLSIHRYVSELSARQDELGRRLRDADGLDFSARKRSFPSGRSKCKLGAFFQMMIAHERRHTFQALQVRQHPAFPA